MTSFTCRIKIKLFCLLSCWSRLVCLAAGHCCWSLLLPIVAACVKMEGLLSELLRRAEADGGEAWLRKCLAAFPRRTYPLPRRLPKWMPAVGAPDVCSASWNRCLQRPREWRRVSLLHALQGAAGPPGGGGECWGGLRPVSLLKSFMASLVAMAAKAFPDTLAAGWGGGGEHSLGYYSLLIPLSWLEGL